MQHTTPDPIPEWAQRAERVGLRLEEIAVLTGKSYSAVYRYKRGDRPTPPDWLAQVRVLLRSRELRDDRGDAA
jgi:hypothetical protein